jgi:hypothetical protein
VDTKDVYYALARMDQLTGYTVSLSKDSSDAIQSMSGAITTGGQDVTDCQDTGASNQDVTVHAETNGGTFDSTLDQLPTSASFSLAPDPAGDEIVDYQASAPIRKITADATGFSSFESLGQGGDIVGPLDRFHGEIDCLPAHMTLVLYKSGETSLNTYGKHIGKVVAQVYNQQVGPATPADVSPPDASDATNPAPSGDQLAYYDTASKGISIDLNNVGGFDYVDDGTSGILKLKYDLDSTTPIAYHYAASGPPALELDGSVDHPQPGTLTVNTATEGTIDMHFAATANSSNLTGDGGLGTVGFDGSIIPQTGSAAYLQGVLANVPANLDVCVDYSTGVEDCSPSWVYQDSLDLNTDNPPQNFAVQVIPTDLNGEIPTTPLTFSGAFCFGTTSQSACYATGAGEGGGPAGVFVGGSNPLTFNALILGFGQHTDDCGDFNYTCGRVWAGIDTTDEGTYPDGQLSGQARYYGKGQKEPEIRFNTATGGYVQTDQLYAWADYSAGSSTGFDEVTDGKIKCGSPETLYLNELGGINLLRNSVVGLCP